jgi:hypothetical protein
MKNERKLDGNLMASGTKTLNGIENSIYSGP